MDGENDSPRNWTASPSGPYSPPLVRIDFGGGVERFRIQVVAIMHQDILTASDFDRLGDLVSVIGSREFGRRFYAVFKQLLDVEECTVFSFPDPSHPQSLIVAGNCEEELHMARRLAKDYVDGGFLYDPNVKRSTPRQGVDIYVMDADTIQDASYREHFYEMPHVSHELVVLGNTKGTLYYTSFYRKKARQQFGVHEVGVASSLAGFMIKALHRHSELVRSAGQDEFRFVQPADVPSQRRAKTLDHLKDVLVSGPHKLSNREAEICACIVLGFSTEAISLNCAISVNTVATHRKRAYAKLGISSQNELFVRYFSAVRELQATMAN